MPHRISNWSLTSLQQRLVKTDGRLIKHARYCWLLLAESHRAIRPLDATVVWQYVPAASRTVVSGGIAEAVVAGKSFWSHQGWRGCLTKADGKTAVSSFGTRDGVGRALSRAPGPSQRKIARWSPSRGV